MGGSIERDFVNGLRELADDVVLAVLLVHDAAVGEAGFQIEAELRAVLRHAAPAPFEELPALCDKHDLSPRRAGGGGGKHTGDEMHRRNVMSIRHAVSRRGCVSRPRRRFRGSEKHPLR